jgi:hypothetical protein
MADIQWGANYGLGSVFGHEKARVGGHFWAQGPIPHVDFQEGGSCWGLPALIELPHTIATSSATPLCSCSQQAVLHRCVFAKTLHNTKASFSFSLYRPLQVSCRGPDHATAKARSAWGGVSAHDRNKQCYTAVLASSSGAFAKQCYTAVLNKTLHNTKVHAE